MVFEASAQRTWQLALREVVGKPLLAYNQQQRALANAARLLGPGRIVDRRRSIARWLLYRVCRSLSVSPPYFLSILFDTGIVRSAFLTALAVQMLVPVALFLPYYARITQAGDDEFLHSLQYRECSSSLREVGAGILRMGTPDFTVPGRIGEDFLTSKAAAGCELAIYFVASDSKAVQSYELAGL
jgi:hypothetical protein